MERQGWVQTVKICDHELFKLHKLGVESSTHAVDSFTENGLVDEPDDEPLEEIGDGEVLAQPKVGKIIHVLKHTGGYVVGIW